MKIVDIKNNQILQSILNSIGWNHAFVREMYLKTNSYLKNDKNGISTMNADALPTLKMIIITGDNTSPVIEFILGNVSCFEVYFHSDVFFKGYYKNVRFGDNEIILTSNGGQKIIAETMSIRFVEEIIYGDQIYLINELR